MMTASDLRFYEFEAGRHFSAGTVVRKARLNGEGLGSPTRARELGDGFDPRTERQSFQAR